MTTLPQWPFPPNLFIATPRSVSHHASDTTTTIFSCTSTDSIVASCAVATPSSPIYAVASSHVVLLCSATCQSKPYTLRTRRSNGHDVTCYIASPNSLSTQCTDDFGLQNTPRLLFSPDAHILYFSTPLTNGVQAYHIPTASLLPPLSMHPSPSTVIAVSSDGRMLLSASPRPPTICVRDLRSGRSVEVDVENGVDVTCAIFQSDQGAGGVRFVLGLKDGNIAVYGLQPLVTSTQRLEPSFATQYFQPTRIGLPTRLHSAAMGGVCAADFLPGHGSRIVSLGYDSRCRIADFVGAEEAKILRTWSVNGEATCLSIFHHAASDVSVETQCVIAIGTKEGTIGIFNILGLLIHKIMLTEPIVSVQWVGNMGLNTGDHESSSTGRAAHGMILRVAPTLASPSTAVLTPDDLFVTAPTRTSSLLISRKPTRRRASIHSSTFRPPGSSAHSQRTISSLQLADPIPIEDGSGNETQFFTPESTQRISNTRVGFETASTAPTRTLAPERPANASGGVYSPPVRLSSLPDNPKVPRRRSEVEKRKNVAMKRIGVHIRQQTETPEWLTPRPIPTPTSFPFAAPSRPPPPIPPTSSSVSPLSTPRTVAGRQEGVEEYSNGTPSRVDTGARNKDMTKDAEDESSLLDLRKDHEEMKAEVGLLRREVGEIKALLSPQLHPQLHPQVE